MAGNTKHATTSWNEIPVTDRVSHVYRPLQDLDPARLSSCHCLAYGSGFVKGASALLLHEEGTKTYLRGWWKGLGLTEACGEREVEELRGQRVMQVTFSHQGTVYILVEDGTLFSSGRESDGLLGRPYNLVAANRFGAVPVPQSVRRVEAGYGHVLAMTEDQVFAFGYNSQGQLGILGCRST